MEGTGYKTIVIPDADVREEYRLVVTGTGDGTVDIVAQVPDADHGTRQYIRYEEIPVNPQMRAMLDIVPFQPYESVPETGSVRDNTAALIIDSDGDGFFETEAVPGQASLTAISPLPVPESFVPVPSPTATATRTTSYTVYHTLTVTTEGSGAVTPSEGTHSYRENDTVALTAVPDKGWAFAGWEGDISGADASTRIVMDRDITVTARFTRLATVTAVDQENAPSVQESIQSITSRTGLRQSFVPAFPNITAVEVYIETVGSASYAAAEIILNIYDAQENLLASARMPVTDEDGDWVRYELKDSLEVSPGQTCYLELVNLDNSSSGWACGGDTYGAGSASVGGKPLPGDFFFRTFGPTTVSVD